MQKLHSAHTVHNIIAQPLNHISTACFVKYLKTAENYINLRLCIQRLVHYSVNTHRRAPLWRFGDGSLVRRVTGPRGHWSEGSLVRKVQNGVFLNIMEMFLSVRVLVKTLILQL